MPKGYTHPAPADVARRIYGTFTSILHTDHEIDEVEWSDMPDEIKSSFIEAVDMVIKEELETMAEMFDREVTTVANKKAQDVIASSPPPGLAGKPWIGICYYCGVKKNLIRWGACQECLKS